MSLFRPTVFRLSTAATRGTAFLLQPGYVLTAAHCVPDTSPIETRVRLDLPGKSFEGKVIWRDPLTEDNSGLDAAIIKVTESVDKPSGLASTSLIPGRLPKAYSSSDVHWHAFGYPVADVEHLGLDLSGSVAGVQEGTGFRRLQLTCDQFGSDGSGLMGASGAPISVNTYTIALVSRNPKQFRQRIVYATLLEDIFAKFFVQVHDSDAEALRPSFSELCSLDLDECDRSINRYLTSLRKRGQAFHGNAIRTPNCKAAVIDRFSLDTTYVHAKLHKISTVHDFWTDPSECFLQDDQGDKQPDETLAEVVAKSLSANGRLQLLIAGDAGSGKTTLLSHLALKALFSPSDIGLPHPMIPLIVSLPELAKTKCKDNFPQWLAKSLLQSIDVCSPSVDAHLLDAFEERLDARWLLLFDGFDEIPELMRNDLRRSFNACVIQSQMNWCLTSRPATNLLDPIIDISQYPGVQTYKILPWTEAELSHFAVSLLGDKQAANFLEQFKFVAMNRSTTTPLLTLIAVCVYEHNLAVLPKTKSELFNLFVDNCVLRGLQRPRVGKSEWMDENDREPLVSALGHVGLYSLRNPSLSHTSDLQEWSQEILQKARLANSSDCKTKARTFIQDVAVGGGLISYDSEQWRWWHSLIRDYLAAEAIANQPEREQLLTLKLWENSMWKEVIVFMIAILSAKHRRQPETYPDVTHLFRYLSGTYVGSGLLLYIALAEGAAVDVVMESYVIESLVEGTLRMGSVSECKTYDEELEREGRSPIQLLTRLIERPAAYRGLERIRDTSSGGPWMRSKAEQALERKIKEVNSGPRLAS